jgi:hypothetical protein
MFRKLKLYLSHVRPTVSILITVSVMSQFCVQTCIKDLGIMLVNCIFFAMLCIFSRIKDIRTYSLYYNFSSLDNLFYIKAVQGNLIGL